MMRCFAALAAAAFFCALSAATAACAAGPAAALPNGDGWAALGPPRTAGDEQGLFDLINGGAEIYVSHGFGAAAFQMYRSEDGRRYNVEIVEMKTPTAARTVYRQRMGNGQNVLDLGEEGLLESYYLIFRQGPSIVTVTALDPASPDLSQMVEKARIIEKRLHNGCGGAVR